MRKRYKKVLLLTERYDVGILWINTRWMQLHVVSMVDTTCRC